MILIIEIALGILLGFVLIENRKAIFETANALFILTVALAVLFAIGGLIWWGGSSTVSAVHDYKSADWLGKKLLFGGMMFAILALMASTFGAICVFAELLTPKLFREFCDRRQPTKWTIIPQSIALVAAAVFASFVPFANALGKEEAAWQA